MSLAQTLIRRLLFSFLTLLFLSLVTFLAAEIAPGDQATYRAGEKASPEAVERLREQLGLNRPWPIRYGEYIGGVARGDFGRSFFDSEEPVSAIIGRNLPMTLQIAALAIGLASIFGILFGTIAGVWREGWPDRTVLIVSTLGVTIPTFVLAPLFVYFFTERLDILPGRWSLDRVAPDYYYLAMPVLILAARPMAQITRLCRASMIDTLRQEFMRLALAKGVPPVRRIVRHGLRNAILPVVTAIGTNFGILLTGSFIIERFFLLPGIGRESIEAIQRGDTPVIQATVLIAGALFLFVNLLVDLLTPIIDPRVREAQI